MSSDWINRFKSYLENGQEFERPSCIENKSLLQNYNPQSKTILIHKDYDTPSTTLSTEMDSSSSDIGTSDVSNGVMGGNSPIKIPSTNPLSPGTTSGSYIIVHSDTSPTTVTADELDTDTMDERTKRRLKWAKKREEEEKQSQKDDDDGDDDVNPNVLKNNIIHHDDYYAVGDNAWVLLRSKFGFDIDIELPLIFSVATGKLRVDGLFLRIPENGMFRPLEDLLSSLRNTGNPNEGDDSSDDDLVSVISYDFIGERKITDLTILLLCNIFKQYADSGNNKNSSSPVMLLPPSTTSYADALNSDLSSIPNDNESMSSTNHNSRKRKRYGLGLGNLGNTCFMNSTLQCLAHTGPLRSYFLSGEYANDLNKSNPLGTGGELAVEFAKLLAEMWGTKDYDDCDTKSNKGYRRTWTNFSGSSNVVYPRDFKYILGKHAEQFMGYNQHDSQELATYLLDALHEDTNRISKKPYIEKPEQGDNETDREAADRAWDLNLKREDSRVMENFTGQVKSRVECPTAGCGRVSTTFDPFMYLSVPLPGATERTIEIIFYSLDANQRGKRLKVTLAKHCSCSQLRNKVAEKINSLGSPYSSNPIVAENIILAETFHSEIYTFYDLEDDIDKIRDGDHVVAYEVSSIKFIHDEIEMNQDKMIESCETDDSSINNTMIDRPNGRLQLDIPTLTMLNKDQSWETYLSKYIAQPLFLHSLLNPRRHNTEEREDFYKNICKFINRCYSSSECIDALKGTIAPSNDLELESSDGDSSEDGKMSPTSAVATRLGATVVDDKISPSLEEISAMSSKFKNVISANDVAILEFCSKKFHQYLQNEKESKKAEHNDGAEIQVVFKKSNIGQNSQNINPLILRISPSLTVFGFRQQLANRLSRVLRRAGRYQSSKNSDIIMNDEELADDNERMDCSFDHHHHHEDKNNSDSMNIMRQIPLTYERGGSTYSNYRYNHKHDSYRRLGSIAVPDDSTSTTRTSMFAMADDNDEKEFVLDHVDNHGKVNLCLTTPVLADLFDTEEWSHIETITDQSDENDSKFTSVVDCISKYCQVEQLEESEMWYCNRCKEHVCAWKQFHLYRTPPILIIHLKRFHYSATTHRRDKIDSLIDFPLKNLDLRNQVMFWDPGHEPIYDCYAVSNHFGGLGGGHYTAYALNDDGEWCNFDDSRVTTNVDESEVVSSAAYVLYYKRHDVKLDDESWINRALPSQVSSSRVSTPISNTDVDIETADDGCSIMDESSNENDHGNKFEI